MACTARYRRSAGNGKTRAAQQREELALLQLGRMYQKGIGVEVNLSRALILLLIAYRRVSVRAANHLAFMFKKGLGTERDDEIDSIRFVGVRDQQ